LDKIVPETKYLKLKANLITNNYYVTTVMGSLQMINRKAMKPSHLAITRQIFSIFYVRNKTLGAYILFFLLKIHFHAFVPLDFVSYFSLDFISCWDQIDPSLFY